MPDVKFGDVVSACVNVVRSNTLLVALTGGGFTALYSVLDLASSKNAGSGVSIASIFVQYFFIEKALKDRAGSDGRAVRKFGSLFLSSFLGSLGILVGVAALVVPGVYLMARWSISAPLVIADKMNGREALSASWKATKAAQWPLLFVFLAGLGVFGMLFAVLGVGSAGLDLPDTNPTVIIATNLLMSGFMVAGWILSIAIYRLLNPAMDSLAEVFS